MNETAKRAALATLVVGGIVVAALALWKLRLVLFFAFIIAAAMRPGIEWLKGHGVPRGVGLLCTTWGCSRSSDCSSGSWCRGLSARCSRRSAVTVTVKAFEILLAIFFTLATAAYWIFERERDGLRRLALTQAEAQEDARHLGPDRPEARCVRADSCS